MPGAAGSPASSSLSQYLCCLEEHIWTAQEGTVSMSHKGHNWDRGEGQTATNQVAGVTTTPLQAATEGKRSKFILSFSNRGEFKV